MSWSTSVPPTEAAGFEAAIDAAQLPEYTGYTQPIEADEQLAAAKHAVKGLWQTGVVGSEGWFGVSFSGHTTPGHQSNDSISVSLYRATAPVTPEPALAASSTATP